MLKILQKMSITILSNVIKTGESTMADFVNVNVKVGNNTQQLRMEKGVVFENKGGKYTIDANGQLMKFDKNSNVWVNASQIDMTRYQWEAFQNVSDNDGQVGTYSKRDIQLAQAKYREGGFTADMKQNLPAGYRIESPRLNSAEGYVQVNVTNGKESQSATLRFQIAEMNELREASQAYQANQSQSASRTQENRPASPTPADFYVPARTEESTENGIKVTKFYNSDGFLIQEQRGGHSTSYTYENGKISQIKVDGRVSRTYTYTSSGVTVDNGSVKYIYDKNNNLVKIDNEGTTVGDTNFSYDSRGRLSRVESSNGESVELSYSGNSSQPTQMTFVQTCDLGPDQGQRNYTRYDNIKYRSDGSMASATVVTNQMGEDHSYQVLDNRYLVQQIECDSMGRSSRCVAAGFINNKNDNYNGELVYNSGERNSMTISNNGRDFSVDPYIQVSGHPTLPRLNLGNPENMKLDTENFALPEYYPWD